MKFSFLFKGIFYLQKFNYYKAKAKIAGLRKTALYIRGACIRTLRVSKRISPPGHPPYSKTKGGLRVIEAAVYSNGAIIGPVKFPNSNSANQPVTHIHEFGGLFVTRQGYANYPQRSYMNYTLQQLLRRGVIPKEFSVGMARQFG
jgi:hypothetical protein